MAASSSPVEAVEACIRRIERVDRTLDAFVEVDAERALEAAGAVDARRPARVRRRADRDQVERARRRAARWSSARSSWPATGPGHSAYLVRRLRDAGFVVLGTTRMPEFGILPTTEPRHGGPVRNPWDTSRTPGGSSGGSAAAVAAGLVPIAHGNDGGGSLRIPAACCGLVGLKPSRGRISRGPDLGDSFLGADGVLSRTVAETALLLDVMAGYEAGDANWAPRPAEPFTATMQRAAGQAADRDVARQRARRSSATPRSCTASHEAAAVLRELGHEVEEAGPPVPEAMADLFIQAFAPHVALGHRLRRAARRAAAGRGRDRAALRATSATSRWQLPSTGYLGAVAQLQFLARGDRRVLRRLRPAAHAGPGQRARCRSASSTAAATIRRRTCCAPARSRRTRRSSTSRASRRSASRSASATTGCRPRCSSSGTRWRTTRCCRSRRRWSRPGRGRAARRRCELHPGAIAGGAGAPLVLLHGFTDTWRTWELVAAGARGRHDVLALTLAGHAGGPPLPDPVTSEAIADAVERAMDDAGFATAHVAGNSLGGYVALQLAARGRADSVVALAPAGGWAEGDEGFRDTLAALHGRCRSCWRARCRTSRRSSPRPRGGAARPRTSPSTRSCSRPT